MPMIGRRFTPGLHRAAWGFMQSGDFPVPVLHLKFGKNTGVVAYDSSPEENDADIDGASWVKGYLGPGLDFDGVDDLVNCGVEDVVNPTTYVSVEAVLKWDGGGDASQYLVAKWRVTGQYALVLTKSTGNLRFRVNTTAGAVWSDSKIIVADTYYHIVGTYDGAYVRLYVDGVEIGTANAQTGLMTANLWPLIIGMRTAILQDKFSGIIDEVEFYDVALTAAQIRQPYLGIR